MKTDLIQWHRWHPESFAKAAEAEKAVFLFVTHAGCDWCVRMEQESFSDAEIAGVIERDFVPLRVDSYERPDIGRYAHRIFTQMTGREASDPLCLFLSPQQVPLYASAYLPDRNRNGMMGLRETLELLGKKYQSQKGLLLEKGGEILHALETKEKSIRATRLDPSIASLVSTQIQSLYDSEHGGFGERPKFPRHSVLELLMDSIERNEEDALKEILQETLEVMSTGGLRDSTDGGFHHYCTDRAWQEPYQGKILYHNALMSQVLLRASAILGEEQYRILGLQTVSFMQSKLLKHGLFSALYHEDVITDTRVVVSWNAMAVKSLFLAGAYDRVSQHLAIETLSRLLEHGMQAGELYHSFLPGETPATKAFLEDYAFLGDTLLTAYEKTGEAHYRTKASGLISEALRRFFHAGVWRYSEEEPELVDHAKDGITPSAPSTMAMVLQRASKLIDPAYEKFALRTLEVHSYALMREPLSMPQLSRALLASIEDSGEIKSLGRG